MSDPFASAAETFQFIGNAEPSDLGRMQQLLAAASAEIRRFTAQTLSQVTDDVVTLPAIERTTLILPERPVTAVTLVVAGGVTVPSTDYWVTRAGILHSGTISVEGTFWSLGATVTYTHGYAEGTDEYEAIKKVCIEVAADAYTLNQNQATQFMGNTTAETAGFAPSIFLTPSHKMDLGNLGQVPVG